jgi:hypothetical protein
VLSQRALAFLMRPVAVAGPPPRPSASIDEDRPTRPSVAAGLASCSRSRSGFLRYFDSTMQMLVERGHHVSVA